MTFPPYCKSALPLLYNLVTPSQEPTMVGFMDLVKWVPSKYPRGMTNDISGRLMKFIDYVRIKNSVRNIPSTWIYCPTIGMTLCA